MKKPRFTIILVCFLGLVSTALAQSPEEQADALRKAQDPLADVKALMTDNTVAFGTADDQTSYRFQLQPVYSIPTSFIRKHLQSAPIKSKCMVTKFSSHIHSNCCLF
jgi:hypothetical protein